MKLGALIVSLAAMVLFVPSLSGAERVPVVVERIRVRT